MNIDAASAYAAKHEPHALVISASGVIVHEAYGAGHDARTAHALYSGTKSFWGVTAVEARNDGLLDLDEPVVRAIPEFADDMRKRITVRMLLQMTAGYGFGGLGTAVPEYDRAIAIQLKNPPGTTFTYGGIPLQIFGAFFSRILLPRKTTPHEYLRERVLEPAGVTIESWRTLKDGRHPLPTGVRLTARDWLAYGLYVMQKRAAYADAFIGSEQNPRYGCLWWLGSAGTPEDLFYASGSGGQALYVVPSQELVVVRFGAAASYKHDAFLKRLFS